MLPAINHTVTAYLGQMQNGHRVDIDKEVITFHNNEVNYALVRLTGVLSNLSMVHQLPNSYTVGRLTEDNGTNHEIKGRLDMLLIVHQPMFRADQNSVLIRHGVIVCRSCFRNSDVALDAMAVTELDPNTRCARCDVQLSPVVPPEMTLNSLAVDTLVEYEGMMGRVIKVDLRSGMFAVDWWSNESGIEDYSFEEDEAVTKFVWHPHRPLNSPALKV